MTCRHLILTPAEQAARWATEVDRNAPPERWLAGWRVPTRVLGGELRPPSGTCLCPPCRAVSGAVGHSAIHLPGTSALPSRLHGQSCMLIVTISKFSSFASEVTVADKPYDPNGLDTFEGQLTRGPWRQVGDSDYFTNGTYRIQRHKLDCRLGGGKHHWSLKSEDQINFTFQTPYRHCLNPDCRANIRKAG